MNNVKIKITVVDSLGVAKEYESEMKIDTNKSQLITFEFFSKNDGGPLIRNSVVDHIGGRPNDRE